MILKLVVVIILIVGGIMCFTFFSLVTKKISWLTKSSMHHMHLMCYLIENSIHRLN